MRHGLAPGPRGAMLAAGAMAVGAYWFTQASVESVWSDAAIMLPVPFAVGAAAVPALRTERAGERHRSARAWQSPQSCSRSRSSRSSSPRGTPTARYAGWQTDLAGAYTDPGQRGRPRPWSSRALEAKAGIALENGDRPLALSAIAEGIERTPDDWILDYQRAQAQVTADLAGARQSLARAKQLSPHDPQIDALAKKLGMGH